MFEYRATCHRVYDGDSVWFSVDLGFTVKIGSASRPVAFRLYGLDTPELRRDEKEAGYVVRDWLRSKIEGKQVTIRTHKPDPKDKYGRWLAEVILDDLNLNDEMVIRGFAKRYYGGTKEAWTADEIQFILDQKPAAEI